MAVMENYQSTPHIDKDLSNSVISWFLEGKCSMPHLLVLNTSSFVNFFFAKLHTHTVIMNLVRVGHEKYDLEGNFYFLHTKCFFQPRHRIVILF
jgi:hypothetical protein